MLQPPLKLEKERSYKSLFSLLNQVYNSYRIFGLLLIIALVEKKNIILYSCHFPPKNYSTYSLSQVVVAIIVSCITDNCHKYIL